MEASQVNNIWKLGSGGVRPYRLCRIHRGDFNESTSSDITLTNILYFLFVCFKARKITLLLKNGIHKAIVVVHVNTHRFYGYNHPWHGV